MAATHVQSSAWEEEKKKRDQLSSLMGGYLLKGYKMLGTNCPVCGMILMRTPRDGIDYCIQCSELNEKAGDTKTGEQENSPAIIKNGSDETVALATGESREVPGSIPVPKSSETLELTLEPNILLTTEKILLTKIQWASQELTNSTSIEHCTQLCTLVKACTDALKSVREITQTSRAYTN